MTYEVVIASAAESDLRDAFLWYEEQKPSLGSFFEEHVNEAVEVIRSNPIKVQVRYKNTRVYFLKRFPYGIHFNGLPDCFP